MSLPESLPTSATLVSTIAKYKLSYYHNTAMAVLCACNMETNVGWSPSQGGDYHQVIASKIIEQVLQLMKLKTHITPNQSNFIGKDENKNEWVSNTPIHVGKHTRILTLCDFFSHINLTLISRKVQQSDFAFIHQTRKIFCATFP